MWTVYKREIIAQEKENREFLKQYYRQSRDRNRAPPGEEPPTPRTAAMLANGVVLPSQDREDDCEVELDSDEEMPQKPKY